MISSACKGIKACIIEIRKLFFFAEIIDSECVFTAKSETILMFTTVYNVWRQGQLNIHFIAKVMFSFHLIIVIYHKLQHVKISVTFNYLIKILCFYTF